MADTVRLMSKIQRYGAQRWAGAKRSATLPSWGPMGGLIALIVVVLWIIYSVVSPHSGPSVVVTPTIAPVATTSPSSGGQTSTTGVGIVGGGAPGGVAVREPGGAEVYIAASAVNTARAAARAYYTGNWSGITLAPGFSPKIVGHTSPVIHSMTVDGPGSEGLSFTFEVSPQRGGAEQALQVVIISSNGLNWSVSYAAAG